MKKSKCMKRLRNDCRLATVLARRDTKANPTQSILDLENGIPLKYHPPHPLTTAPRRTRWRHTGGSAFGRAVGRLESSCKWWSGGKRRHPPPPTRCVRPFGLIPCGPPEATGGGGGGSQHLNRAPPRHSGKMPQAGREKRGDADSPRKN